MTEAQVGTPDSVRVQREPGGGWLEERRSGVLVRLVTAGPALRVEVAAPHGIARVHLRWRRRPPHAALVLGDAWERSYGELEWRSVRAEAPLPWTVLIHDEATGATEALGVEVRGGAFAFWTVDRDGVGLWLDLRSGGGAVRAGDRAVHAATVRRVVDEPTPYAAQTRLAALQNPGGALPVGPVVGANNWYYAYGQDFDQDAVVRDARTISELADGHPVRPFGVIDDGWSIDGTADGMAASGGPWDRGRAPAFRGMADAAAAIRAEGVRPGIWFRPLLRRSRFAAGDLGPRSGGWAMDPSAPAVLDVVEEDVRRLVDWGFELIKHDFSTFDVLGRWGSAMGPSPAEEGPALVDPTITTAEALVRFYERVLDAAGGSLVLGCNTVGHLAAGLVHLQRTGDDTSGREWDRTRRMGVNTLAFRLAQHGRFFAVDADCVPSTHSTDWARNRGFLDLVARSGTALFVSVDPGTRSPAVDADLQDAIRIALDGGERGGVEPLDWLRSPTPSTWRIGKGATTYDWIEGAGADPFEP